MNRLIASSRVLHQVTMLHLIEWYRALCKISVETESGRVTVGDCIIKQLFEFHDC